jgi:phage terminase small subunit
MNTEDEKLSDLSARHERFCREYIKDRNGARAYMRAGFKTRNRDAAAVQASRLLRKPKVQERIAELEDDLAALTGITAYRIARELELVAFFDPHDVMTWGPHGMRLRESKEVEPRKRRAIAEISEKHQVIDVQDDGAPIAIVERKVKLHDKLGALNQLNKMLGYFKPEKTINEHTGKDGTPLPTINISFTKKPEPGQQ